MARAFDWQSKGQRFDSAILHFDIQNLTTTDCKVFLLYILLFYYFCFNSTFIEFLPLWSLNYPGLGYGSVPNSLIREIQKVINRARG